MDEPLSNLDAKLRTQMRAEIAEPAARARRDDDVCHPRPGRGDDDGHADRGHAPRRAAAAGAAPGALTTQPDNLFVATFIGSPTMNLLRGRIERDGSMRRRRRSATDRLGWRANPALLDPLAGTPAARSRLGYAPSTSATRRHRLEGLLRLRGRILFLGAPRSRAARADRARRPAGDRRRTARYGGYDGRKRGAHPGRPHAGRPTLVTARLDAHVQAVPDGGHRGDRTGTRAVLLRPGNRGAIRSPRTEPASRLEGDGSRPSGPDSCTGTALQQLRSSVPERRMRARADKGARMPTRVRSVGLLSSLRSRLLSLGAGVARSASAPQVTISLITQATNEPGLNVLIANFERVYPNITVIRRTPQVRRSSTNSRAPNWRRATRLTFFKRPPAAGRRMRFATSPMQAISLPWSGRRGRSGLHHS